MPPEDRTDPTPAPGAETAEAERLFGVAYGRLRSLARRHLSAERSGHTLQPTALVHEAYVKLAAQRSKFVSETQFVAVASQAMRRILVDHARRRSAEKRGGGITLLTLKPGMAPEEGDEVDVLVLDDALRHLEALDERQARVVELRFFGGLGIEEAAEALGISRKTVVRDWRRARSSLARSRRMALRSPGPRVEVRR